jgi:predicted AAA+ superfamily ATPase
MAMQRNITQQLLAWKTHARRKPLILRGARQVGKTWSVNDFGKSHFKGSVRVVDLEKHPEWHRVFEGDLVAKRILSELEILLNTRIVPGDDLLFIDEIQTCPRAITALRYFCEECPELHVIAAGSLLEFATRDISFPVGRVQFLNMAPLSFAEFLRATGKDGPAAVLDSPPIRQPDVIHRMMLDEVRQYMFVGGMPECVAAYAASGKIRDAAEVHVELADAYRQDFSKYTPHVDRKCLTAVFASVAGSVGRQIKYSHLAEGFTHPTIKKAFDLLCLAQAIRRVPSASPSGLPLGATASARNFKALMVDIGVMQHLCGMPMDAAYAQKDLLAIHQGAMAEQFVGQELAAAGHSELHYWAREAKSSSAEVDFLVVVNGQICPVEVKSGAAGRLRGLRLLMDTYPNCRTGYVLSCAPYAELPEQGLVFLPLYYAGTLRA